MGETSKNHTTSPGDRTNGTMAKCIQYIPEIEWNPTCVLYENDLSYALLVLNQPILIKQDVIFPIFRRAKARVTVDGGTDRWFEYLGPAVSREVLSGKSLGLLPDMVTGDFDSIKYTTLQDTKNAQVLVVDTPDQNRTDFCKALIQLFTMIDHQNILLDAVYVLVEHGGRFDHIISNIHTLYRSYSRINSPNFGKIILLSKHDMTWLLPVGRHRIKIPKLLRQKEACCGLIPFGSSARVTTTGLKWNLRNTELAFGEMISTSNTYDGSSEVTVVTDTRIVWTMEIGPLLESSTSSE